MTTATIDRDFSKRWTTRREFRVRADLCFDPSEFGVDVITDKRAKPFIQLHHYSGSYPAARLAVGMFRKKAPHAPSELVGTCVFSVPMNQNAVPKHLEIEPAHGAEIGRFVLTPEVGFNGETWFLARAMKLLRSEKPAIRGLISYADPLERTTLDGILTKRQHWGQIYKASNAFHGGRGTARTLILSPDGSVVSERSLSKIRNEERGHVYAAARLIEQGAPKRELGEAPAAWVARALASPLFRRVRHPGNLVYLFPLYRDVRAILEHRVRSSRTLAGAAPIS